MILAQAARMLPADWQEVYGYRPVLLETFVETPRFKGTCYKAANWTHLDTPKVVGSLAPPENRASRSKTYGFTP